MAKRFAYVSFGILCLVAAYQLGAERATADWDLTSPGQIVGASGPADAVYTADGTAWFVDPEQGWIKVSDFEPLWDLDLPVPAEDVKFLGDKVLITKSEDAWLFQWGPDAWVHAGPFPGTPFAEPIGYPGSIGRAVDSLHRSNHAQVPEPRKFGGVQMLRVLDTPTQVVQLWMVLEGAFENVQCFAIRPVTDGVDA